MLIRSKSSRVFFGTVLIIAILSLVLAGSVLAKGHKLSDFEQLGRHLYFDENLSEPSGQSCASCHDPDFAFVDPDKGLPVSEGVIPGRFGGRNSPMAAYAMYAPTRYFDDVEGLWIGGQFWDSRATGEELGDPLADQALGPFLNMVEMANPDKQTVIADILDSDYSELFIDKCGDPDLGVPDEVEAAYNCMALAIGAFERTELFAPFSSKYDAYLKQCIKKGGDKDDCAKGIGKKAKKVGKKFFSKKEWRGFQLFMGENNNDGILAPGEGAMCSACHVADWTKGPEKDDVAFVIPDWAPGRWIPPLFTDFTYDNLGVPKSKHPLLRNNPIDLGLGPIVEDENENGKFKVMTLRNIAKTKPYAHNGFFRSLRRITHFYNTRDVKNWDAPEVPDTVNTSELGNLGLSAKDEIALVKFMRTLSDGYMKK